MTEEMLKKVDAFIENHPKGHFLQSRDWAPVKPDWKQEIIVATDRDGEIKGVMTVLIRKLPVIGKSVMYAARGPVCDVHDKDTIKELLTIDKQSWLDDVANIKEFYAQVGDRVPAELYDELAALEARLKA